MKVNKAEKLVNWKAKVAKNKDKEIDRIGMAFQARQIMAQGAIDKLKQLGKSSKECFDQITEWWKEMRK